ncbi:hypothetical protein K431DRAFT_8600 [Polychaeton citri CBS 116435]|uniref:Uncharacterized protein n=1 Tax=Polychaeton citri CBS 116435 TaxID=1314669 RepID=A0A9P4USK5_9PEZI|nr:hypothetical protein K431DRAFT_8600 [Polychaeton citri CBS 116435]
MECVLILSAGIPVTVYALPPIAFLAIEPSTNSENHDLFYKQYAATLCLARAVFPSSLERRILRRLPLDLVNHTHETSPNFSFGECVQIIVVGGNIQQPLWLDMSDGADVVLRRQNKLIVDQPFAVLTKYSARVQGYCLVVLNSDIVLVRAVFLRNLHKETCDERTADVFVVFLVFKRC